MKKLKFSLRLLALLMVLVPGLAAVSDPFTQYDKPIERELHIDGCFWTSGWCYG